MKHKKELEDLNTNNKKTHARHHSNKSPRTNHQITNHQTGRKQLVTLGKYSLIFDH